MHLAPVKSSLEFQQHTSIQPRMLYFHCLLPAGKTYALLKMRIGISIENDYRYFFFTL